MIQSVTQVFMLLDAFLLSKNENDPLFNSRDKLGKLVFNHLWPSNTMQKTNKQKFALIRLSTRQSDYKQTDKHAQFHKTLALAHGAKIRQGLRFL